MELLIELEENTLQKLKIKSNEVGIDINELANNYISDALDKESEFKESLIEKMKGIDKEESIPLENIDDLFD